MLPKPPTGTKEEEEGKGRGMGETVKVGETGGRKEIGEWLTEKGSTYVLFCNRRYINLL